MYAVYASLLYAVRADLLAEAGRIACESFGKLRFGSYGVYKLAYHRMLRRTYKVEVLALDFIHHIFHFGEAHNAVNNISSYHKRRNIICEASVYHKVARI